MAKSVLVIDDEQDFLDSVRRGLLTSQMTEVTVERDPVKAADFFLQGGAADIALIDVTMPGMSGVELLEIIKTNSPETECIMITGVNDTQTAISCMKKGAYDYLLKPLDRDDLVLTIKRAFERKRLVEVADIAKQTSLPKLKNQAAFAAFITQSLKIVKLLKEAELHAVSDVPILITGETGTGKDLLANAIHQASRRAAAPFMPVNMAALSPTLFDAEFFGHTRGAFTGAEKDRTGYLEHADKGTVFLDEVGALTPELQGKLLRVLQEQEFYKLGSSAPHRVDIRFVAATNVDLARMVSGGVFRKDLFYRLKGAWLHLPPLRERKEDIPLLVQAFLNEFSRENKAAAVHEDALLLLKEYDYPGNIRELKSIVQSSINLAGGKNIAVASLPESLRRLKAGAKKHFQSNSTTRASLAELEKEHILRTYEMNQKNKTVTAGLLEIGLNTLRRKLKSYGIE